MTKDEEIADLKARLERTHKAREAATVAFRNLCLDVLECAEEIEFYAERQRVLAVSRSVMERHADVLERLDDNVVE